MTVTPLPVHRDMTDEERRAAARRDLAADPTLTGAAVARRYERSDGWGRKVAREVRASTPAEEGGTTAARGSTTAARGSTNDAVRDATPVTVPVPRRDAEPEPATPDVPRHSQAVRLVTIAAVLVVACTAAVISYAHMRHLAIEAGEGWRADILPLSVDGMMVVASMTALARRRAGKGAALAWVALLMGVVASMAANIASAQPTLQGRLMAAWPPLALVVAFELLLQQGRDQ